MQKAVYSRTDQQQIKRSRSASGPGTEGGPGSGGQTPQVAGTGSYLLEWTSKGPGSNLEGVAPLLGERHWGFPMFDNTFPKSHSNLKKIEISELIGVLQHVCQLSFLTRSEKSSSFDFDRSLPYLAENGLRKHITFVSSTSKNLPLNSERHLYGMNDIVIRNLHIDLNDRLAWTAHDDWEPLSHAAWHFENCCFEASSNMWSIDFPWRGRFRFYKNEFNFRDSQFVGHWLFIFQTGSWILLQGNNFRGHRIQTRCVPSTLARDASDEAVPEFRESGSISFVGNRAISNLGILEGYSAVSFAGMNRIENLWLMKLSDAAHLGNAMHTQEPMVYFGPREKIDRHFHYCLQHRQMFLRLRHLAAMTHDARQLSVLDKQIDRIEYFLNKEQDAPYPLDYRIWIEYWQDRLLYAWRRWSSDFYKSWMRPLSMIILGYMLLNAAPALIIDAFSLSHWIEFTLRPIGEIAEYEQSLNRIVGGDYDKMSSSIKNWFRLFGFIEVIWIAMWSFAFARSIKRWTD